MCDACGVIFVFVCCLVEAFAFDSCRLQHSDLVGLAAAVWRLLELYFFFFLLRHFADSDLITLLVVSAFFSGFVVSINEIVVFVVPFVFSRR